MLHLVVSGLIESFENVLGIGLLCVSCVNYECNCLNCFLGKQCVLTHNCVNFLNGF